MESLLPENISVSAQTMQIGIIYWPVHCHIVSVAIIRDVVQRRFEVYHKLEEAARLAVEQEAAAKAAEERKKAEEIAAKAAEEAKAEAAEQGEQEGEAEGDGRETADKPDEDSVAGEDGGSEPAPTADTPAESGPKDPEPVHDADADQE